MVWGAHQAPLSMGILQARILEPSLRVNSCGRFLPALARGLPSLGRVPDGYGSVPPEAFAGKWESHSEMGLAGVALGSLSFAMEIITIKSLSLKLRGWFFQ